MDHHTVAHGRNTEVSDLNMGKALTKLNIFNAGLIDLGQNR
jgi:hypothetical protein